jgi:hypothetical protein
MKNLKLIPGLFLLSTPLFADFEAPAELFQGLNPTELNVADLNGDGKKDIVFVDGGSIKVLYQKSILGSSEFSARLGVGKYFEAPYSSALNSDDFTVSMWVNLGASHPEELNRERVLFSNGAVDLAYNSYNSLLTARTRYSDGSSVVYHNSNANTRLALELNTWYNITVSHSASLSTTTIYINGAPEYKNIGAAKALLSTAKATRIGGSVNNVGANFEGLIDEVAYFGSALTKEQVSELYNFGSTTNLLNHTASSSLVSWWTMGDDETDDFNTFFGGVQLLKDVAGSNDATPYGTEPKDKVSSAPNSN